MTYILTIINVYAMILHHDKEGKVLHIGTFKTRGIGDIDARRGHEYS